jgi:hypothetical protein
MLTLLTCERSLYSRHVRDDSLSREFTAYIPKTSVANLETGTSQSVTLPRDACGAICQLHVAFGICQPYVVFGRDRQRTVAFQIDP